MRVDLLSGLFVMGALALPQAARGAGFALESDARPRVANNKIITDAFDDATGQLASDVRTFGWRFQTIPGDPYFLQDPGFNSTSGSGLPAGSALGFRVTRGLSYWSGAGAVDFTTPMPAGESLAMNFASGTVTISSTSAAQSGFDFVTIGAGGAAHRHLNTYLLPGSAATPTNGVYFTSIRLTSTSGVADSAALFLLFGNGVLVPNLQRGLAYVANPFPGDANYSSRVDIADFAVLAANFNGPGERFWYDGDFNGDGTVAIGDFALLAGNFNQSAPAGRASIPEPLMSTFLTLILLFFGGGKCGRSGLLFSGCR